MALSNEAKKGDELPEEVVEEMEAAEKGGEVQGDEGEEAPVTFKLSRRKKEQQERDARMEALEARAAKADEIAAELQRTREETAQVRGALEMLSRQQHAPAQQQQGESAEDQMKRHRKERDKALAASDLDAYHEHTDAINQIQLKAAIGNIPQPQQQQFQPQKPDWVRAVEYQYPDVMTNPNGQRFAAAFESVIPGDFGPDKLHRMFQRARAELGPAAAPAAHSNGTTAQRRELFSGVTSNSVRSRPSGDGEKVTVPREYLVMAGKSGMTKAQAVKAWKDSYGEDR